MRSRKKGLHHDHSLSCTIWIQKAVGMRRVTDEENAQVFCEHFYKIFNNQNPLPCYHTALSLILQHAEFMHLAELPSITKVWATLCYMSNGIAPGPSDVSSDALKSMVWTEETPDDERDNDDTDYLATVICT
eukprot:5218566-Ditylum_brightwellii.AAC.1